MPSAVKAEKQRFAIIHCSNHETLSEQGDSFMTLIPALARARCPSRQAHHTHSVFSIWNVGLLGEAGDSFRSCSLPHSCRRFRPHCRRSKVHISLCNGGVPLPPAKRFFKKNMVLLILLNVKCIMTHPHSSFCLQSLFLPDS